MRFAIVVLFMAQLLTVADARAAVGDDLLLRQAIDLSLEAEFERSLALFDQLLAGAELDATSLTQLLSERSFVLYALGKHDALEDNLHRLARVDASATLGERAPPELVMRWQTIAAAAQQQRLSIEREPSPLHASPALAIPLAPGPRDTRKKRALLIAGAVLTTAATVVVALALTVPSSSPADRTSVRPSVEF